MPSESYSSRNETRRHRLKDKKLSIYRYTETLDNEGVPHEGYQPLATNIWAYVRQIGGGTYFALRTVNVNMDVQFFVNWTEELSLVDPNELCVVYRNRVFKVKRIDTYEDYKRDICMYAEYDERTRVRDVIGQ